MSTNTASPGGSSIVPLRVRQGDGTAYARPPEIEATLETLTTLPVHTLLERARITDSKHPDYVPSECVLYFVRRMSDPGESGLFELFTLLRQRVRNAVPVLPRKVTGVGKPAESIVALDIQEAVLHKFQVLLCLDRKGYDERLDFYECRFNSAVASLRATAQRDVRRNAARFEPLESESEQIEPSPEVEKALLELRAPTAPDGEDFLFRSKLLRAISLLPVKEQRVIELLLQGYQIHSIDEEEDTIAKILNCDEKTVRNRRDRACLRLKAALGDEEETS